VPPGSARFLKRAPRGVKELAVDHVWELWRLLQIAYWRVISHEATVAEPFVSLLR